MPSFPFSFLFQVSNNLDNSPLSFPFAGRLGSLHLLVCGTTNGLGRGGLQSKDVHLPSKLGREGTE